jgi:hypothetical protein
MPFKIELLRLPGSAMGRVLSMTLGRAPNMPDEFVAGDLPLPVPLHTLAEVQISLAGSSSPDTHSSEVFFNEQM